MFTGKLDPKGMITAIIELNEIEEKGFKALIYDKNNHVKILVKVT
jgi:threonine dehydrogenase-like Zn-dependent dehydrogenase